ncbi:MAG: hypothetical protein HUJ68_10000 [Clostridia bacterium]|nr:hypothetical protein [Clostridia bacterium]
MTLSHVNLLPTTYNIESCTIDGEDFKNGNMWFYETEGIFGIDLTMEEGRFKTVAESMDKLLEKVNEHVNFGLIKVNDNGRNENV